LENAHAVNTITFDKTGTLTTDQDVLGDLVETVDNSHQIHEQWPSKLRTNKTTLWLAACTEEGLNAAEGAWGTDIVC